jgi:phosphoribosylamine---glycine ligase
LSDVTLEIDPRTATTVMMVAGGYPGDYEKGKAISGLEKVNTATVFHAGTKKSGNDVLSNGGRVMAFTALGNSIQEALDGSFAAAKTVSFEGCYYRKDIGQDLLKLQHS